MSLVLIQNAIMPSPTFLQLSYELLLGLHMDLMQGRHGDVDMTDGVTKVVHGRIHVALHFLKSLCVDMASR